MEQKPDDGGSQVVDHSENSDQLFQRRPDQHLDLGACNEGLKSVVDHSLLLAISVLGFQMEDCHHLGLEAYYQSFQMGSDCHLGLVVSVQSF